MESESLSNRTGANLNLRSVFVVAGLAAVGAYILRRIDLSDITVGGFERRHERRMDRRQERRQERRQDRRQERREARREDRREARREARWENLAERAKELANDVAEYTGDTSPFIEAGSFESEVSQSTH